MKIIALLFSITLFLNPAINWLTDFEKAKAEASVSKKNILLNFSGSDWCIPCIKMKKEVFESASFQKYAEKNLVLMKADFPRLKKNQLDAALLKNNESLAAKYNKKGVFPLTVLLNANGKVLKTWEGYPKINADDFIKQMQLSTNAR